MFAEGGEFVINTENYSALNTRRTASISEAGKGGGTYFITSTVTPTSGNYATIYSTDAGNIDLSKAKSVSVNSKHGHAIYVANGGSVNVSKLNLDHYAKTGTTGIGAASVGKVNIKELNFNVGEGQYGVNATNPDTEVNIGNMATRSNITRIRSVKADDPRPLVSVMGRSTVNLINTELKSINSNNAQGILLGSGSSATLSNTSIVVQGDHSTGLLIYGLLVFQGSNTIKTSGGFCCPHNY